MSLAETPKKSLKGKPLKEPSCNDFCRVYRCNFESFYGVFSSRVSTKNLHENAKRPGVAKCRLANLASELCKVCNKDKKHPGIDVFNSITGVLDRDPTASSLQFSPTAFERS